MGAPREPDTTMHFALSDEQSMIRDTAELFLAQNSASAAVRSAMDSAWGFDGALWQRIGREMGWCATAIPVAYGGLGLGLVELGLLLEQMGRRQTCAPFFSTVAMAATALSELATATAQARWLPQIANGSLRATLALSAQGVQWDARAPGARAKRTPAGWQLDGCFAHVADGSSAELLLVVAQLAGEGDGDFGLFAVAPGSPAICCTPLPTWDATRRLARIALHGLQLQPADRLDGGLAAQSMVRLEALMALLLAAEQLGGAQQCLDMTLAHTAARVQFGQSLSSFQAVKHRCADMMVRVEATRSCVYGAAAVADARADAGDLAMEAGAAKSLASDAFFFCAQEAIQLHGGVGFTWDYDPQLYFKRAQAGSHWLGSPERWRERIACALLDP